MDSKAKRGHSSNIAFSKVYYSLILSVHPFAQKELDITSPGPPDHFLLSYVKAKCIFVGLEPGIPGKSQYIYGEL